MYLYTDMPSHVSQVLDLPLLKALAVAYKDLKKMSLVKPEVSSYFILLQ